MRRTGKRSSTSRSVVLLTLVCLTLSGARPARALDLFTLWRQPEIPLRVAAGDWVDYRGDVMAGGRRQQTLTRIACVGLDDDGLLLEIVPLTERPDGGREPLPGEGVRLRLSPDVLARQGRLLDCVIDARHWSEGRVTSVSAADLRDDPLVSLTLDEEFTAETVTAGESTTRVVGNVQFLCAQLTLAAADTQRVRLPAGDAVQVTTREITAAVAADVPFLGLAYVAERVRSSSHVEGGDSRRRRPPPRIRVEIMELVDFGDDAKAILTPGD